jgi:hypothetical protein
MVLLCINLGCFSGLAFYAVAHRENHLAPIADGQTRALGTAPSSPAMNDHVPG